MTRTGAALGGRERGQLVIVAAAAIAIALFPMALAYLQLGYAGDVAAGPTGASPSADVDRALDRVVQDGAGTVDGTEDWSSREAAIDAFRQSIEPDLRDLETARLEEGIGVEIEYAAEPAEEVAAETCPSGENRAFGPCDTEGGVVVQERADETVVVAAAFDVRVTRTDGVTELTLVVEVSG